MTHEDVMQMLAETEIPFAYDHFAEGESLDPPFICFLFPGSENFAADNVVYMEFSNLSIEYRWQGRNLQGFRCHSKNIQEQVPQRHL